MFSDFLYKGNIMNHLFNGDWIIRLLPVYLRRDWVKYLVEEQKISVYCRIEVSIFGGW